MASSRTARQRAIRKLDRVFSRWVRWSRVGDDGKVECYTCRTRNNPENVHCGHFQSRRYMATRWDENNCRPQCVACNIYHQGRQYEFGRRLDAERDGLADEVIIKSRTTAKFALSELNELIQHYNDKVRVLEE